MSNQVDAGRSRLGLCETILSMSPQGIVLVNDTGIVVLVNEALCSMSAYRSDELLGHSVEKLLPADYRAMHIANRSAYLQSPRNRAMGSVGNLTLLRKDGVHIPVDVSLRRVSHREGQGTVAFVSDKRGAQEADRIVKHQATHDALTGLANRRLLKQYMDQELSLSKIGGKRLAVLVVDLDGFKLVNSYGHAVGDKLLISVAKDLTLQVRGSDIVARVGGDEFVILLRNVEKLADAVLIAEKLVTALSHSREIDGHSVKIGCSVGVSVHPDHSRDAEALLRCADLAMYDAKENGKGRSCVFRSSMAMGSVKPPRQD